LALCIKSGDLCWVNGPFPAGANPDLEIFRSGLMTYLEEFERVEADDGYIGEAPLKVRCPKCITTPLERKEMMAVVRMRHETVNRRMKQWRCLKDVFRHGLDFHETCFTFCAVMTQIAISNGEPLFQVDYSDNFDVSDDEGYDDNEWSDLEAENSSDSEEEEEEDVNSEEEEEVGDSDVGEGDSDSEEDEGFVDRLEEVSDSDEEYSLDEMEEAMM
jgi:hypothetical protein